MTLQCKIFSYASEVQIDDSVPRALFGSTRLRPAVTQGIHVSIRRPPREIFFFLQS